MNDQPTDPRVEITRAEFDAVVEPLRRENAELREWIETMQKQNVLTCVYCGHEYPPGSPRSGTEALTEHVRNCPKHPMADLQKKYEKARALVVEDYLARQAWANSPPSDRAASEAAIACD